MLGGNRFVECDSILAHKGTPILKVRLDPLRVELATPQSFAVFWQEHALAVATLWDACTVHLKVDLRPLGIKIHDGPDGLHIGQNVFSGNVVSRSAAAISLGD
jgi:hypothetical protein